MDFPQRIVHDLYDEEGSEILMELTKPRSLKDKLKYAKNRVSSKVEELDYKLGKKIVNEQLPIDYEELLKSTNDKLKKGVGIKKTNSNIELGDNNNGFIDVIIDGKKTGHLNLAPLKKAPKKFTDIIFNKDKDYFVKATDIKGEDFKNAKYTGFAKQSDYPFENLRPYEKSNFKGLGLSGEINEALSNTLKENGQRLYSGATGHSDDGIARYYNLLRKGAVEDIKPTGYSDGVYMYKKQGGETNWLENYK